MSAKSRTLAFCLGLIVFAAACQSASAAAPAGGQPAHVDAVTVEIGVGSPIPIFAVVDLSLPDTCAQVSAVALRRDGLNFNIDVETTNTDTGHCAPDSLPYRMTVPLNLVNHPVGTYAVAVNGVSATFSYPPAAQ